MPAKEPYKEQGRALLREIVKKYGTQSAFSEEIKVDPFKISRWTTGKQMPKGKEADALAKALGVQIEMIYGDVIPSRATAAKIQESNAKIEPRSDLAESFSRSATIRSWRGAAAGFDDSEVNFELEGLQEVSAVFLTNSPNLDQFDLVRVSGRSLEDRIGSGDKVLIYRDSVLIPNSIVLATSPEFKVYLKVLREVGHWELHSISPHGSNFKDLTDWKVHGYATAIFKANEEARGPNIEFRYGSPLKA